MPLFAATVSIDLAIVSTGLGIAGTIIAAVIYIGNLLNNIENRFIGIDNKFEAVKSVRELDAHKVKSALKFLRYEQESIKGFLSKNSGYHSRNITPNTGADFLNE